MNHREFKRARQALGLSVRELAEVLGVTRLQVRRMERDPASAGARTVSAAHAERLRNMLRKRA